MNKIMIRTGAATILGLALMVAFQNCSQGIQTAKQSLAGNLSLASAQNPRTQALVNAGMNTSGSSVATSATKDGMTVSVYTPNAQLSAAASRAAAAATVIIVTNSGAASAAAASTSSQNSNSTVVSVSSSSVDCGRPGSMLIDKICYQCNVGGIGHWGQGHCPEGYVDVKGGACNYVAGQNNRQAEIIARNKRIVGTCPGRTLYNERCHDTTPAGFESVNCKGFDATSLFVTCPDASYPISAEQAKADQNAFEAAIYAARICAPGMTKLPFGGGWQGTNHICTGTPTCAPGVVCVSQ